MRSLDPAVLRAGTVSACSAGGSGDFGGKAVENKSERYLLPLALFPARSSTLEILVAKVLFNGKRVRCSGS